MPRRKRADMNKKLDLMQRAKIEHDLPSLARTANRRLAALEKRGLETGAYRMAARDLAGRSSARFYQGEAKLESMSDFALEREYNIVQDFLASQTSTVRGETLRINRIYKRAKERGYSGSIGDFEVDVARVFNEEAEKYFSSDVLYEALTTGNIDLIEKISKRFDKRKRPVTEGEALIKYLREKSKRKARKK